MADDQKPDLPGIPKDFFGRGVFTIYVDTDGAPYLEHKESGEVFKFAFDDIDELIGLLTTFRAMNDDGENGPEDENGEL